MHELNKLSHFLYFLLVLSYCLLTVSFAYWGMADFGIFSSQYSLLKKNWSREVITDIFLAADDNCPASAEYLYDYSWPGTGTGCNCKKISAYMSVKFNVERTLTEKYCNKNQTVAGCINIHAIPKTALRKWYENKTICARRLPGITFLEISSTSASLPQSVVINGSEARICSQNYTLCGTGSGELCIPGHTCPITDIVVGSQAPGEQFSESIPFRFDYSSNTSLQIYLSRNSSSEKLPLAEFKLSESEVCQDKDDEGLPVGRKEYILRREKRRPCEVIDKRFELVDSISESDLFTENRMSFIASFLPDFQFDKNVSYGIYKRNFIAFNKECRFMMDRLLNYGTHLKSLEKSQIGLYFVSLVCAILVLGSLILFNVTKALGPYEDSFLLFIKFLKFTFFMARFFVIPFATWALAEALGSIETFAFFRGRKCSDEFTNGLIESLIEKLYDKCLFYVTLFFSVIGAMALMDILILIIRACINRSSEADAPMTATLLELNKVKEN